MTSNAYPAGFLPSIPSAIQAMVTPVLLDEAGVLHHLGQVRLGVGERAPGGMSRSTLHALIRQGAFPRPVPVTATKRGKGVRQAWPLALVESWVNDKVALAYGDRWPRDTAWLAAAWADGDEPRSAAGGSCGSASTKDQPPGTAKRPTRLLG